MELSFKEKYSYGIGAFGKDLVVCLVFTYIMSYFTDVLQLNAAFVGTMFFVVRLWDAVNDLAMGMLVENTRSKYGKFKPWLVIGTLINSVIFILLFTTFNLEGTNLYVYATVMYVLWGMTYTIMDIPYWSMLPNLTKTKEEREQLSVIPRIFASIAGLIVGGLGLQIIDFLGKGNDKLGFTYFSIIISVIFIITVGITVLNVKERQSDIVPEKVSFKEAVRVIVKNEQLLIVIGTILTFNLAIQIINVIALYYFKYVCGKDTLFSVFTAFSGIAEITGLVLFPKLVKTFSREKVYKMACLLPVAGLLLLLIAGFIAPTNSVIVSMAGILLKLGSGFSLGSVTVILADVVDYGEYKNGTRNESLVFSVQTLLVKLSSALGSLLTGFALTSTGYVPNQVQSASTILGMRIVMIGIPIVCVILSLIIYNKFYKLKGIYYDEIMEAISLKRSQEKLDSEKVS